MRLAALLLLLAPAVALASGPRYVTGPPYFTTWGGQIVAWNTNAPMYFTDPADLSASVNHQAADALVAAAAGVWNVPVANMTLARGGALAEHVSGSNVYLSNTGMVYPADVQSTNATNIPIAVIYDSDGSVTDTLLGGGASDPAECRQNGVTESVDGISPAGYLYHAVLILNGRCTGPVAAQQLQLQYQLERAFGRILGLAWSQNNDNVFTGTPTPSHDQAMNWPILHPLDILCGSYTYQCLPQPFQLRTDDIGSLVLLYPITQTQMQSATPPANGKTLSYAQANTFSGWDLFPTGEGMAGVNVVIQRMAYAQTTPEAFYTASAVTGAQYRHRQTTPVAAASSSIDASEGSFDPYLQGYYNVPYLPLEQNGLPDNLTMTTEPVNPLYSGNYAVGPYTAGAVKPSGSSQTVTVWGDYAGIPNGVTTTVSDASATCGSGSDGTASEPAALAASGWWNGLLCGYNHSAWTLMDVRSSRTLTIEVTALDEQGYATTAKAMPVMGAWASTDSTNSLPTLGAQTGAFNALDLGMTSLNVATGSSTGVQFAIADQRGDGRPDYAFQGRVLYADSIFPSTVAETGGTATITGVGFRPGNVVKVNGVNATVTSWGSNTIVLTVPAMTSAGATAQTAVDVVVSDISTGGSSTMSGALTYSASAASKAMKLLSAQVGTAFVGAPTSVPFSVQVVAGDGVTPVAGDSVVFTGSTGVQFGVCGAASCTVTTDSNGVATTAVTPQTTGTVTMTATDQSLSQTATFTAIASPGSMQLTSAPSGNVYVGDSAATPFAVTVLQANGSTPAAGQQVTFSATSGSVTFDTCVAATCVVTTNQQGVASTGVTPRAAGATTVRAALGILSQSASFNALGNTPLLTVTSAPAGSYPDQSQVSTLFQVQLTQADGVTPITQQKIVFTVIPLSGGATAAGIDLGPCLTPSCSELTDYLGHAAVYLALETPGTYMIQAAYGQIVKTTTVTVETQSVTLKIISAPSGIQVMGAYLATPFTVQLIGENGVTPMPGFGVEMGAANGTIAVQNCNTSNCIFTTDGNGYATIYVQPLVQGTILLEANLYNIVLDASFTSVSSVDTMQLVSSPASALYPGSSPAIPFAVQVIGAGQLNGTPGKSVVLSVTGGSATLAACGAATCTITTNANGIASSVVTPHATGTVSLLATEGPATQTASFVVSTPPDIVRIVSAPSGSVPVGMIASTPFAAQVLLADGVTPAAWRSVTLSVTSGSAALSTCGSPGCVVTADGNGNVSTKVQPLAVGTVGVSAIDGTVSQTATFNAVAGTEMLRLVSAPSGSVLVGTAASTPFAVQVLAADGVTPIVGRSVTFAVTSGSGSLAGCNASPCILFSGANGMISTTLTPSASGTFAVQAADGTQGQSASVVGIQASESLTALMSQLYVAERATVTWTLQATAMRNGAAGAGLPVTWSGSAGLMPSVTSTVTGSSGTTSAAAAAGPLTAGTSATASACLAPTVCVQFQATGSSAGSWLVQVTSGGAQAVTSGAALAPVVITIVDGSGHTIAGAPVTLAQTVTERTVACPTLGRCPAAPVLASGTTQATSDINGQVSVTPMTVNGVPTSTNIAVSAGTSGFATVVLDRSP